MARLAGLIQSQRGGNGCRGGRSARGGQGAPRAGIGPAVARVAVLTPACNDVVVIGNSLYWVQNVLIRLPTWPLLFRLLATTSSSYIRFAGDCVLVWAAYALPTFLAQWPGTLFCYRGLGRGGVWAAGCVAWFYVLVAVNAKLFSARPRTRLGRRPPTRAASSIRSSRGDGVGPELTFFPSMPTAAP